MAYTSYGQGTFFIYDGEGCFFVNVLFCFVVIVVVVVVVVAVAVAVAV